MEGSVSILAWPGYVEDGSNDPTVDWVTPVRGGDRLSGRVEGLRHVRRGRHPDEDRATTTSWRPRATRRSGSSPVATSHRSTPTSSRTTRASTTSSRTSRGTRSTASRTVCPTATERTSSSTTRMSSPRAPTSWDVVFDKASDYTGKVTAYDSPIYIADAAVYLMAHQPDLGITNPYALDETQFQAAVDLLKQQRPHISEYWSDYLKEISAFESGDSVVGTTWQAIENSLEAEGAADRRRAARRGCHGLVRHLDDRLRGEEPELRLRVARTTSRAPRRTPRRPRTSARRRPTRRRATSARTARRTTPATPTTRRRSGTGPRRSPTASTVAPTSSASTTRSGRRPGPRSRADLRTNREVGWRPEPPPDFSPLLQE